MFDVSSRLPNIGSNKSGRKKPASFLVYSRYQYPRVTTFYPLYRIELIACLDEIVKVYVSTKFLSTQ